MADVASKQQTTAFFSSTTVTSTRRHTELTKILINLLGNLCCAREHSVQFFVQFFTQPNYTIYLRLYGALNVMDVNKILNPPLDNLTRCRMTSVNEIHYSPSFALAIIGKFSKLIKL